MGRPRKPTAATSLREMLVTVVNAPTTLEMMRQTIDDTFATTKASRVVCPQCAHEFRADLPDVRAQVTTMIDLLEQVEGKAGEDRITQVVVQRPPY